MGQAAGMVQGEIVPLIVDNGSFTIKSGLVENDHPSSTISTMVGHPHSNINETVVGNAAQAQRDTLDMVYPLEKGIITHWDEMEKVWAHIFQQELQINTEQHPVLLTESPFNPADAREKTLQVLFETFQFPGAYLHTTASLALIASGRGSGCVIDSGYGATHVMPVQSGTLLKEHIRRLDIAGKELTFFQMHLLRQHQLGIIFPEYQTALYHAQIMKETLGYVAGNYRSETQKLDTSPAEIVQSYTLPDGQEISLGEERFKCPEVIFQPSLLGQSNDDALPLLIQQAVQHCDEKVHKIMYNNILFVGGSTLFPNFAERVKHDLSFLLPPKTSIKTIVPPDRIHAAWKGGAMMTVMSSFLEKWITKEEYAEEGASAVLQRKCPL